MRRDLASRKLPALWIALGAIIALALGGAAAAGPAAAQALISADFGTNTSNVFSGREPRAESLDPAFAAANVWNQLAGEGPDPATDSPSWSSLMDSRGVSTAVSFSVTGSVGFFDFGGTAPTDALFRDYMFFHHPAVPEKYSSDIDWRIAGLIPGAIYQMVLYGASADVGRTFNMLVDTDGDGDLSDEVNVPVITTGGFGTPTANQLGYLSSIRASAAGEIIGRGVGVTGNEADWAGFQLAYVDTDHDGVPDGVDACPNSDLSPTVVFDRCEINNVLFLTNGCTTADLIAECAASAPNHSKFVKCVAKVTKQLTGVVGSSAVCKSHQGHEKERFGR